MRLVQLDNAHSLDDLRLPPSNQLEKLSGNRKGQYSIALTNSSGCVLSLKIAMLLMLK